MVAWQLKTCRKCHGDLVLDGDEWRCWQCGHYYYPRLAQSMVPCSKEWSSRAMIAAKERANQAWWQAQQGVISLLSKGKTIKEISNLTGKSEDEVREVRLRLKDSGGLP